MTQITAYVILIDNLLAKYGEEAQGARVSLRQAIPAMVDRIWREGQSMPLQSTPFKAAAQSEAFYQRVQELQPSNDIQRGLNSLASLLWRPANATTLASLVICALSVSVAIVLILELDQPFGGMMVLPSEPLRNALSALSPQLKRVLRPALN